MGFGTHDIQDPNKALRPDKPTIENVTAAQQRYLNPQTPSGPPGEVVPFPSRSQKWAAAQEWPPRPQLGSSQTDSTARQAPPGSGEAVSQALNLARMSRAAPATLAAAMWMAHSPTARSRSRRCQLRRGLSRQRDHEGGSVSSVGTGAS
jgi:hypothetical protein